MKGSVTIKIKSKTILEAGKKYTIYDDGAIVEEAG